MPKPDELVDLPPPAEGARLPAALETLYVEHAQPIYYFILRMVRDPGMAEDAVHDVFLKAFRNLHQWRGRASLRSWLYRIALNHCRNLVQKWHFRHMVYDPEADRNCPAPASDSPLRVLEIKELGDRIQAALDHLPEEYRILLLMLADEGLSYEEMANLTGQSPDAVRGKIYRARKAFVRVFAGA